MHGSPEHFLMTLHNLPGHFRAIADYLQCQALKSHCFKISVLKFLGLIGRMWVDGAVWYGECQLLFIISAGLAAAPCQEPVLPLPWWLALSLCSWGQLDSQSQWLWFSVCNCQLVICLWLWLTLCLWLWLTVCLWLWLSVCLWLWMTLWLFACDLLSYHWLAVNLNYCVSVSVNDCARDCEWCCLWSWMTQCVCDREWLCVCDCEWLCYCEW